MAIATAQRRPNPAALSAQGSAQGGLTVTTIIASSVGVVMGPDRQEHLVAANAVDPADNVSKIEYVQLTPVRPVRKDEQKQSKEMRRKKLSAKPNR
jgi:hypothetical protein